MIIFFRSFIFLTFVIFIMVCNPSGVNAEDSPKNDSYEARAVHAFLLYCLPGLTPDNSVERIAELKKLPELSAAAEAAFLNGQSGKVFGIPEVGPGIVLTAPKIPMCSIIIQSLDPTEFISQVDFWFDPDHSPFKLTENKTLPNGEIRRQYTADIKDNSFLVIVKVRPQPLAGGMQAMLSVGRSK